MKPVVHFVGGPTASGKTAYAISLALQLNTEIVSADSRQFYKELNIGVARPSEDELAAIKHWFIASHSIFEPLNAGTFEQEALPILNEIVARTGSAVVVGGSGMFLNALAYGMDDLPKDELIREHVKADYQANGLDWLQTEIRLLDPAYAETTDMMNHRRLMRAMEVIRISGHPYSTLLSHSKRNRAFDIEWHVLNPDRAELYDKINRRVDMMIEAGLEEEARSLYAHKDLQALRTVGYTELFSYFDGEISLERAVELIKQNSRNYAKRQVTWFKHQVG